MVGSDVSKNPIPLPRGRQLVTLEDAGKYITQAAKAEHEAREWQAAMEALILVATSGGPTMFARIGMMRALNRNVKRVFIRTERNIIGDANGPSRYADRAAYRRPRPL